ncbi:hypothetical protein [Thalassotalea crassostreae]|uniref:hypothetical protein n=1 Tax=Thalassotalea crassostreae TaxID=1763536 RepID=UPI0008380B5D|nr:hypothetical protein [Thalassotalea crassostreae]
MSKQFLVFSAFLLTTQLGCANATANQQVQLAEQVELALEPCSPAWNSYVEDILTSGDDQGHGPDIGSDEWKSVIEFKLDVRGNKEVPSRNSKAWCSYIDNQIKSKSKP